MHMASYVYLCLCTRLRPRIYVCHFLHTLVRVKVCGRSALVGECAWDSRYACTILKAVQPVDIWMKHVSYHRIGPVKVDTATSNGALVMFQFLRCPDPVLMMRHSMSVTVFEASFNLTVSCVTMCDMRKATVYVDTLICKRPPPKHLGICLVLV